MNIHIIFSIYDSVVKMSYKAYILNYSIYFHRNMLYDKWKVRSQRALKSTISFLRIGKDIKRFLSLKN